MTTSNPNQSIELAVSGDNRNWTHEEIETIQENEGLQGDLISWFESNQSDGYWTEANIQVIQDLRKQS